MVKKIQNIIFLGPPGSGKGTQAEMLAKEMNLPIIGPGKIFREEIKEQTKIGQEIWVAVGKGEMLPDDFVNQLMKEEVLKKKYAQGVILDGYPRSLYQVNFLEQVIPITHAILVNISDAEAKERISGRRVCPSCGSTYHMKYNPPVRDEICDKCSEKLITRTDDTKQAIKRRLDYYHRETEPVIYYYKQRGILLDIDGEQPIERVQEDILKKLGGGTLINSNNAN